MKIVIVGSGVVGVSSAYYLAEAGHEVTVLERESGAALGTSFANAGQISPGYAAPWAAPGVPLKAIKWMFQKHAPLSIRLDGSLFQLEWILRMLMQCNAKSYAINKARMVRLSEYSRDCLRSLRSDTGIEYEGRQLGTLQIFRSEKQMEASSKDVAVLEKEGVPYRLFERDELVEVEPALELVKHKIVGGLRLPNDETGDCQLFTSKLATLSAAKGVEFRYGTAVQGLLVEGSEIKGVRADGMELKADAVVVALGSHSTPLLRRIVKIPVYPVKGFSITVPVDDPEHSPVSTVLDETYKVAVTRFENRIRVGGMAQLVGYNKRLDPAKRATLEFVLNDLFPNASRQEEVKFWTGLRPMTPDGTPLVGATPIKGLWLNTGHGTLGWTMGCGSARVLSDLISGKKPQIASDDLSIARYAS